jgi:hydrogenase-4 component F
VPGVAVLAALVVQVAPRRAMDRVSQVLAIPVAGVALVLASLALVNSSSTAIGEWYLVDARGAAFLAVSAVVGLASVLLSPAYLRTTEHGFFAARHGRRWYYLALYGFWAILLTLPIAGNLGVAWVLVEASTAASALLVAHSGKPSALEAGWKYLVLTTIGLTTALLGIVVLCADATSEHGTLASLDWVTLGRSAPTLHHGAALLALVLIAGGLAAKVGWAPVHHWLPDTHSEAPPPVSAMLSAALLPAVMLVVWRLASAIEPAAGATAVHRVFIGFGLASLATAIPFLWRSLAWKRLLAYSSLEHVGVLALGIGFANDLAIAGVVVHLVGHALAKALGFQSATALFAVDPAAVRHAPRGLARRDRTMAAAMAVSLGTLTALPPGPLFFSEVLILLGGIAAGQLLPVTVAAVLLALGFLGLAHALVEGLFGKARASVRGDAPAHRPTAWLTGATAVGLAGLSVVACVLPGSAIAAGVAHVVR